jgi:hypothetical protein
MWRRTVSTNRSALMPLAPLGFLGVKKVNEVRVTVVQYLVSQQAGSIRALVVPRLRYFPRLSQYRRLADTPSRNQMQRRRPRVGSCYPNRHRRVLLC